MATSTPPSVLPIGLRVSIPAGVGTIRFVGQTGFAAGKWVGVELDEGGGKNDGSVAGKRYFTCQETFGVFVKPSQIRVHHDEGEEDDDGGRSPSPTPPPSQPSSSKPPSRPLSSSASASRPPSVLSSSRPPSTTTGAASTRGVGTRASVSSSSSKALSSSSGVGVGRSSPVKLPTKTSVGPPKVAGKTVSTSSTSSTRGVGLSRTPSITSPPLRPSSSISNTSSTSRSRPLSRTEMPPPSSAVPLSRTLSSTSRPPPPSSPKKPSPSSSSSSSALSPAQSKSKATSPIPNFAPTMPSTGTPRLQTTVGPGARRLSMMSSTSSVSAGRGLVSPPVGVGVGGGRAMSVLSQTESLMSEEMPEEVVEEEEREGVVGLGLGMEEQAERDGERRESAGSAAVEGAKENDAFSLRGVDTKRLLEATVPKKTHDELLTRLRILEARRNEDREKLRELERLREEEGDWKEVREKSLKKLGELSGEVKSLKRENKELAAERDSYEGRLADLADQAELSLLDKEVAEERFEATQVQLEGERERVAELEVEVGVLREENARMTGLGEEAIKSGGVVAGEVAGSGVSNLAYIQLEKQNERLKDALVRLRDLTSETEGELKQRIDELEKELDLTSDLQIDFENNLVELDRAEAQVEDLKQQLDDALGAEDLLEQLTEKNLTMSERIEEMKGIIEDLEAIQELNDELEENHVETAKQMQEEIDLKDLYLREQRTKADSLEESVADYEGTISQFRELVLSLQAFVSLSSTPSTNTGRLITGQMTSRDLEQLRLHQASQESESQSLTSQSQAMLNLNLKLQSSVLKSQVKTIDLELRKLDAKQALDHLMIVKPYLLPAFFEEDSDAVDSLLFFERLAYKADLISMVMEQTHSVTDSINSVVPEALVGICETRSKLAKYSALNKRFAAQLKRSSPDLFLKMGHVYREVEGTEKRMDGFIEALKREDLREVDCGREVDGLSNQIEHLTQLHLQDTPQLDLAERELAFIVALDLDFDTIAAAAGFTKQSLVTLSKDSDVLMDFGDVSLDDTLFTPLQALVTQARNSKVATKKLIRRLEDLGSSNSALSFEYIQAFETLAYNSAAIATAVSKLATDVATHCSEVRTSKSAFDLGAIIALAQRVAHSELGKAATTPRPLEEIGLELADLAKNVSTTLTSALDGDHVVQLTYEAPWTTRVAELQSTAAVNVDAERKVLKLSEEMKDLVREMRVKDQSYQESAVKIELMERRMESVKKQAEAITELEGELVKSKKQERAYEEAVEALQCDLDARDQEINKLKLNAPTHDKQGSTTTPGDGEVVSYEGNMETSRLVEQIDSLRGAVRFLRSENSYLKAQDLLSDLEQLPAYSSPTKVDPVVDQNAFASQRRQLLREARLLSCTPRLVDLSFVKPGGKLAGWQPGARAPEAQYKAEKVRARELGKKVEKLWSTRPMLLA